MKIEKKIFWIALFAVVFGSTQSYGDGWQIKKGENLKYKIAFSSALTGAVKGGEATLSINPTMVNVNGTSTYHATLHGSTTGIIEWFYQVEDRYETFIDPKTHAPAMFRQMIRENKYRKTDSVYFDQDSHVASYKNKTISIPANTHDFVSMIYFVRTTDVDKLNKGDSFTVPFFTDGKVIKSNVIFNGIEQVKVNKKWVNCYAFKPQVGQGKVFNQDYPATIWFSTDSNRLPMLIEAKMKVGKVKMELLQSE